MKQTQSTQRSNTIKTYEKLLPLVYGKVLDFGAGLCHGTKFFNENGIDCKSFEPHSRDHVSPDFVSSSDITTKFDSVVSCFVLNVIGDKEYRLNLIRDMVSKLKDNGSLIIAVRSVTNIKSYSKTAKILPYNCFEFPNGVIQKGFTFKDLEGEISDATGDMFSKGERIKNISNIAGIWKRS